MIAGLLQKRIRTKRTILVILDGNKVSTKKVGAPAPLHRVMLHGVNPEDEVLVLTLLHVKASGEVDHKCNQTWEEEQYIRFLSEEISQRKETYLKIFKPIYYDLKNKGVKFQVKVAAGFRLRDIIVEEANCVQATWILIDSCLAACLSFRLCGIDCNVSLVCDDDDEETIRGNFCFAEIGKLKTAISREDAPSKKSPKLIKELITTDGPCYSSEHPPNFPSLSSNITEEQTENSIMSGRQEKCFTGVPEISLEVIKDITCGFKFKVTASCSQNSLAYRGCLSDDKSLVLVKRFKDDSGSILEAEKKAALFLHHKNILSLSGYHRSENDLFLIFPYCAQGTLEKYLLGQRRRQRLLSFQDKLRIVIGTAHAVRYMHEECPQGPVVHLRLLPSNIFLMPDSRPMISSFEHAKWLRLQREPQDPWNSCCQHEDSPDNELLELVKSDVLSFGILLLRLFCKRSLPEDDKALVEWARPLLLQGAFHLLLEEDSSDELDMHAIYRVMTVATLCTKTKPVLRPCMNEVISILKGKKILSHAIISIRQERITN